MSIWRTGMVIVMATALSACQTQEAPNLSSTRDLPTSQQSNLNRLAQATLAGGDVRGAEKLLLEAIRHADDSVESHLMLANLYEQTNRPKLAADILKDAAKLSENDADLWLRLARAQVNAELPAQALQSIAQAETLSPTEPRLYNTKGVALDQLGRYEEAQQAYEQAIRLDPSESTYIQNNLALSYVMSGKFEDAIRLLEPLASAPDATARLRQNLALAYGLKGDMDKALAYNLKDLPEEKARENLAFYREYASKRSVVSAHTKASPDSTAVEPVISRDIASIHHEIPDSERIEIPEKAKPDSDEVASTETAFSDIPTPKMKPASAATPQVAERTETASAEPKPLIAPTRESRDPLAARHAKSAPSPAEPSLAEAALEPAAGTKTEPETSDRIASLEAPTEFLHNGKLPSPILKPLIQ